MLEKQHTAAWAELTAPGIRRAVVDVALESRTSGTGSELGVRGYKGASLFENGGAAVGDDVGYGPSRIFSPNETAALSRAASALPRPRGVASLLPRHRHDDRDDLRRRGPWR